MDFNYTFVLDSIWYTSSSENTRFIDFLRYHDLIFFIIMQQWNWI